MSLILPNGTAIDTDTFDEGYIYTNPTDGQGRDFMESIARDRNNPVFPPAKIFSFGMGWGCIFLDTYPFPNFQGFLGYQTVFEMLLNQGAVGSQVYGQPPNAGLIPTDPHITGIGRVLNNEGFFQFSTSGYFFNEGASCNVQYLSSVLPGRFKLGPPGGNTLTADIIKVFATAPAGLVSPPSQVLLYTINNSLVTRTGNFSVNGQQDTFDSLAAFGAVPWSILFVATNMGSGLASYFTTGTRGPGNTTILTPGLQLAPAFDFFGNAIDGGFPDYFLTAYPNQNPPAGKVPSLNCVISGNPM